MGKAKKKKSTFGIFIHKFVTCTFWLIVLIMTGVASYKVTMAYYDTTGGPKDERAALIISEYFGGDAEVEDISKNLILSQNEEGEIKHIVLGIFNTNTENLDYITIPADTRFTISNELYQKLCNAGSEAPQIICLEDADSYFKEQTLYKYMVVLIEDMLGVDIGYYTVISEDRFNQVFVESQTAFAGQEDSVTQNNTVYKISDSFLNETRGLAEEASLKDYLKEQALEYESNLSLKGKYEYAEGYLGIREDYIYAHTLYGVQREDYFDIALEESRTLVAKVIENSIPYMETQVEMEEQSQIRSTGYNIEILNGSGITGLAASYESMLTENGYKVTHIGNYTLGSLTESRIIVKEAGLGQDLLEFIGTGNVEVGTLPEGVDIQILLGTMAER